MSETLYRATPSDLEIRSDGRTIAGIAVPFDEPAEVRDSAGPSYTEVFRRGSFKKTIMERAQTIKLLINHDAMSRLPIGAASLLREDAAGLYGEFKVSKTVAGDEALELVRDGVLDGFSIGFRPVAGGDRRSKSMLERLQVKLTEVSTVAFPAYQGAKILAVRSDGTRPGITHQQALRRLRILELDNS